MKNKIFIIILEILLIASLIKITITVKELNTKSEKEIAMEQIPTFIKTYTTKNNSNNISNNDNLLNCYKNNNKINNNIKTLIEDLNNLYKENDKYHSFLYQDIITGLTISYNEDAPIYAQNSIYAPLAIYLTEESINNNINLNEVLTYKNEQHRIDELIEYTISKNDEIAYNTLITKYKRENILKFWSQKGTKNIFTLNTSLGITNAKDASIYMRELYNLYLTNNIYSSNLIKYFKNTNTKYITNKDGIYNTINKSGYSEKNIHDIAIINDKNPYILIIMNYTNTNNYQHLFNKTSNLIGKIHEEYWKEKQEQCQKRKEY